MTVFSLIELFLFVKLSPWIMTHCLKQTAVFYKVKEFTNLKLVDLIVNYKDFLFLLWPNASWSSSLLGNKLKVFYNTDVLPVHGASFYSMPSRKCTYNHTNKCFNYMLIFKEL